jgi:hypothetical protein
MKKANLDVRNVEPTKGNVRRKFGTYRGEQRLPLYGLFEL